MKRPFRKFQNKTDGYRAAVRRWTCKACNAVWPDAAAPHNEKNRGEPCPKCRARDGYRMHASNREFVRWQQLVLLLRAGDIERLQHQPRFDLEVNGRRIATYVADAAYIDRRTGKYIVEDTKPGDYIDDVAKIKIALFNAIYGPRGTTVQLVKST